MELIGRCIVTLCLVAAPMMPAVADQAGTIQFVPGRPMGPQGGRLSDFAHVQISGVIGEDSPRRLAAVLKEALLKTDQKTLGGSTSIVVFLDSPGGNVQAAVAMGRLLRAYATDAWVDRGRTCASACILVLAGGTVRWAVPGSHLGIHRPHFDERLFAKLTYAESQKKYSVLSKGVKDYLTEMGIADELFNAMMKVRSQDVRFIDQDFAEQTSLLGKDPAHEEWERARAIETQGADFLERLDRRDNCLAAGEPESRCSRYLSAPRK